MFALNCRGSTCWSRWAAAPVEFVDLADQLVRLEGEQGKEGTKGGRKGGGKSRQKGKGKR